MKKILEMMRDMDLNLPLDINILYKIEFEFNVKLPKQYMNFMKLHNGGEGPIGNYGYLAIWDMKEFLTYNNVNAKKKH